MSVIETTGANCQIMDNVLLGASESGICLYCYEGYIDEEVT